MKPYLKTSFFLLLIVLFNYCNTSGDPSYTAAKKKIEKVERNNPPNYLTTDGTYRVGLLVDWVIEGTVNSSATTIQYKDLEVEVSFYSKTQTLIGTNRYVLYEFIEPGSVLDLDLRIDGYASAESLNWEIVGAIAIN